MNCQKSPLLKLAIPVLCATLVLFLLFTSSGHARIPGLTVSILEAPTSVSAGGTIEVVVRISKPRGEAISGGLKSYITAKEADVGGFLGSEQFGGYVALNEEGWGYQKPGNTIYVSMGENDTEIVRTLTNKIMSDCPAVDASLKARLKVGRDAYDDRQPISILLAETPVGFELPTSVKIIIAVVVVLGISAAAVFLLKRPTGEMSAEYPT